MPELPEVLAPARVLLEASISAVRAAVEPCAELDVVTPAPALARTSALMLLLAPVRTPTPVPTETWA